MGRPSDPTSLNRYAYAEGNPTSLIDPGGYERIWEEAEAAGLLGLISRRLKLLGASDPVV